MQAQCPHCKKEIRFLGAGEIKERYGLGASSIAAAHENGTFPEPWLRFNNRYLYLEDEVVAYENNRSRSGITKNARQLAQALVGLDPEDREEALREAVSMLQGAAKPTKQIRVGGKSRTRSS